MYVCIHTDGSHHRWIISTGSKVEVSQSSARRDLLRSEAKTLDPGGGCVGRREGLWVIGRVCGSQGGCVGHREGVWVIGRMCGS